MSSIGTHGQVMTPMDSLYASDSLNFSKRVILKPIQWWQHFSYSSEHMNCQFERSCSNFMVEAIQKRGLFRGVVIGTDRVLRCNPAARRYHAQTPNARIQYDGRLVEPVDWVSQENPAKSPALAVSLSIMPGLGRAYAGHSYDGFLSFIFVAAFGNNAYQHSLAGNKNRMAINVSLMSLFWAADLYGAYRTAKTSAPNHQHP